LFSQDLFVGFSMADDSDYEDYEEDFDLVEDTPQKPTSDTQADKGRQGLGRGTTEIVKLQNELAESKREIADLRKQLADEREAVRQQRVALRAMREELSDNGGTATCSSSSGSGSGSGSNAVTGRRAAGRRASHAVDNSSSSSSTKPLVQLPCREIQFTDITLGEQISGGGFCILYEGLWCGVKVAVKRIFDPVLTDELKQEFSNEVNMLHELRHPHVVNLVGSCSRPPNLVIVSEFCARGSLFHVLFNSKVELDNRRKTAMSWHAALALRFLHSCGVVHRDIKTYNFLVDERLAVKICDFGMARLASDTAALLKPSGTPAYVAPEVWSGQGGASFASDVFAFAMVLNEVWSLEVPFDGLGPGECKSGILSGKRPEISKSVPLAIAELIRACWHASPSQRPTMQHVANKLGNLAANYK